MNTAEKHFALREGHHNAAAEAYFDARPEQDLPLGRKTFEAGFVRAFDLLTTPRRGEARRLSEHEWKLIASLCSLQGVADALIDRAQATHHDLYRALLAKDDPPEGLARAVAATVQHLGFCCLGDRIVRLKLPNGRTLRVSLE